MNNEEDSIEINVLSAVSVFIEMYFDGTLLASGTAFFVERFNKIYLVTNWHNLSGRHPKDHSPLNANSSIPNTLRIYHHNMDDLGKVIPKDYSLIDQEGQSTWFEHPSYGSSVDIGMLPIAQYDKKIIYPIEAAIKDSDPYEKLPIEVGEQVYVLGYPYGIKASNYFPIWKVASIASEPSIDIDDLPKLYIDTATKQGMSGSMVVQKTRRTAAIFNPFGTMSKFSVSLLGVYSGRIKPRDGLDSQIGIVWKEKSLDEIIQGEKNFSK